MDITAKAMHRPAFADKIPASQLARTSYATDDEQSGLATTPSHAQSEQLCETAMQALVRLLASQIARDLQSTTPATAEPGAA